MKHGGKVFEERLSSTRTTLLFAFLALVFSGLDLWRISGGAWGWIEGLLGFFAALFVFYTFNFRELRVRLTDQSLTLRFGIIPWRIPRGNIAACLLDDPPAWMKYGGAGVHFMLVDQRYRASFNFLEYPRVVVQLKKKAGLVKDVSFSTAQPDEWIRLLDPV